MKILKTLFVALLVASAFGGGYLARGGEADSPGTAERRILYYVDPMHPAYKSDKPGVAPDCGMALEPVYADDAAGTAASAGQKKILYYRDPQAPSYTSHAPGLNPETGNTLEPVYATSADALPAGTVRIAPERQQLIGVKYATVQAERSARSLRAVGRVAYDETRVAHVHARFEGWIERVHVDFTGALVRRGQPMLTIYSPEMLASQQELLLAVKARDLMDKNPLASASVHGESLLNAARQRLQLWGLTAGQIDQVLRTGTPIRSVVLPAPASGFVLTRNAFPTQKVTPDTELYTIADLSRVWILADVFETDAPAIRIGQAARITMPYSDGAPLTARVSYIQPELDPITRTLKVRLEVANPGVRLKPEMFVNAEFSFAGADLLTVPADAVLDAGDRQTVFVDRGNGYLEPRPVEVASRLGDRVAIARGLAAGERVVASGTFLVDSESQLRAAASGMGAPAGHSGHAPEAPAKAAPGAPKPQAKAGPAAPKPPEHDHD